MIFLAENWFFVVALLVCVGMHFFHGHGSHKGHAHAEAAGDAAGGGGDGAGPDHATRGGVPAAHGHGRHGCC